MIRGILSFFFVFSILATAPMTGTVISEARTIAHTEMQAKAPTETIQGTIDYMERLGGYFIRGENPYFEYIIVNQNPKVLKTLKESGKKVTIQGYTANQGAEYFFIQKIDGKKFKGATGTK